MFFSLPRHPQSMCKVEHRGLVDGPSLRPAVDAASGRLPRAGPRRRPPPLPCATLLLACSASLTTASSVSRKWGQQCFWLSADGQTAMEIPVLLYSCVIWFRASTMAPRFGAALLAFILLVACISCAEGRMVSPRGKRKKPPVSPPNITEYQDEETEQRLLEDPVAYLVQVSPSYILWSPSLRPAHPHPPPNPIPLWSCSIAP